MFQFGSFNAFGQDMAAYSLSEVPIFLVMGAIGGLFGALYNSLNLRISSFRVLPRACPFSHNAPPQEARLMSQSI
jgi:H+/Cl- antiporter ClcA